VQGEGQLDHSEAGCEVAADMADDIDHAFANLARDLFELLRLELSELFRTSDPI
jgi:hypothetical protein